MSEENTGKKKAGSGQSGEALLDCPNCNLVSCFKCGKRTRTLKNNTNIDEDGNGPYCAQCVKEYYSISEGTLI